MGTDALDAWCQVWPCSHCFGVLCKAFGFEAVLIGMDAAASQCLRNPKNRNREI